MILRVAACLAALCALLFLACYLGTGTDERNMRSFYRYPVAVQEAVAHDPRLSSLVPPRRSAAASFVANLALFAVVLVGAGLFVRAGSLWRQFGILLAIGEGLNAFDLVVIDLLWWRNSLRVRIGGIGDPSLYRDPSPHVASFLRGIPMFALAALAASLVLAL